MLVNVGDTPLLRWRNVDAETGENADPTTVTASLRDPQGGTTDLTVTKEAVGVYVATPPITAAGDWLLTFTSIGPAQSDDIAIHGVPAGTAEPWAPTLRQVGAHIPSRTRRVDGDNYPVGTFNDDTYPSGDQVTAVIGSAVAMVAGLVGKPIKPAAFSLCTTAAALWAAYWVEVGWPERDGGSSVYDRLRTDAVMACQQATTVNQGAGGGTPAVPVDPADLDPGVITGLSSYSFPPPCAPVRL